MKIKLRANPQLLQKAEPVGLLCPHLEHPEDRAPPHLTQKFEFVGLEFPQLLHVICTELSDPGDTESVVVCFTVLFCLDCIFV